MKKYTYPDPSLEVHGVPNFEQRKTLKRLTDDVMKKVPSLNVLGQRSPGVRIIFKTNSKAVNFTIEMEDVSVDIGSGLFQRLSSHVLVGDHGKARFSALVSSYDYNSNIAKGTLEKDDTLENVMLWLPTCSVIKNITVEIEEDGVIESPDPYKYTGVVYYGSSITEGVNLSSSANTYSAIISERLSCDYYNLGFPSNAKGEPEIAEYIANISDISVFVYDYDHNAPSLEHLEKTHEPFFKIIREKHPLLPIIMITRPNIENTPDYMERRDIVKKTYENARAHGDENVWFIDGSTFFDKEERYLCMLDRTHPNDLGNYKMAQKIMPIVKEALIKAQGEKK